jgi:hypothetical protein
MGLHDALTDDAPNSLRIAISFAAVFVGWALGVAWKVATSVYGPGFGYVTDFEAFTAWSGLFALASWAIAFVPIALRFDLDSGIYRGAIAPVFGAVCGIVCLAVCLLPFGGWELLGEWQIVGQAIVVGGVSWTLFAFALPRWTWLRRPVGRGVLLCVAFPFAAIAAFVFLVWPTIERVSPSFAFRLGTYDVQQRVFERVLRELRVGDSLATLHDEFPDRFPEATTGMTGQLGADLVWRIEFEDGRVTKVDLGRRP